MILVLMALGMSLTVAAQQTSDTKANSTSTDASQVTPPKANSIDDEITNAKLRASSVGSKNPFSMKADLSYSGGSVNTPLAALRPNYAGTPGTVLSSSLSGTVGLAYRLTDRDVLRLGTGIYSVKPLQNSDTDFENNNGKHNTDVSNPYLDYSRAWRAAGVQNVFDTSYTGYTQNFYSSQGYLGTFDANHTVAWEFKSTKWSPGINVDANYTWFNLAATTADNSSDPVNGLSDYTFAIFPYAEYAFTDKLSFRTVFRFLTFDHYRIDPATTYNRELYTQSIGFGVAATRDIYFYPNVQFAPEHAQIDQTNVGISASINL